MVVPWWLSWYSRRAGVAGPPAYLNLEPTNRCNLSCVWCIASGSRPGGLLDPALAAHILDQAAGSGVREIRFFLAGEPLLHPELPKLVAQARARSLRSVVHTNAMLLTEDRGRALILAGLDEVSFSINGLTEDRVREAQPGAELAVMAAHVRAFIQAGTSVGARRPRTILQIIQRPEELAHSLPITQIRSLFGSPGPDRILRLAPHGWGGQLTTEEVRYRGARYHPCQPLWQGMSVGWDGRVFLCCADLNGRHQVGDLAHESLMDVWQGEALNHVRSLIVQDRRQDLPLCSSCDAVWWKWHPLIHDFRRLGWRVLSPVTRATD